LEKKSIGCFRISPVLAGKWNALPHARPELLEQQPKAFLEPLVSEITGGTFFIHPRLLVFRRRRMTRLGTAWRPPVGHLIAIKFLIQES
jgi:hypothetical protein